MSIERAGELIATTSNLAQKTNGFWQAMISTAARVGRCWLMKKPSIRTILVPIDFSKMSIQAIETAKKLAQRFQATIH
jgi:hypothetical protein